MITRPSRNRRTSLTFCPVLLSTGTDTFADIWRGTPEYLDHLLTKATGARTFCVLCVPPAPHPFLRFAVSGGQVQVGKQRGRRLTNVFTSPVNRTRTILPQPTLLRPAPPSHHWPHFFSVLQCLTWLTILTVLYETPDRYWLWRPQRSV